MSPRYVGRHTGRAPVAGTSEGSGPEAVARTRSRLSRVRRPSGKKVLLWILMSACVAFVLYAAWGLVQSIDDLDNSPDGDWLCSGHSMTCEP